MHTHTHTYTHAITYLYTHIEVVFLMTQISHTQHSKTPPQNTTHTAHTIHVLTSSVLGY